MIQDQVSNYKDWCKLHHYKPSDSHALIEYCKHNATSISSTFA